MSREERVSCDVDGCTHEHTHRTKDEQNYITCYCPVCLPLEIGPGERVYWSAPVEEAKA